MYKIKIEPKILKGIVAFLGEIVDEVEIKANQTETTIKAMDPSRISMVFLTLPKDAFDEYKCDKETKIPLNLDDFEKILNRCSSNEELYLEFIEEKREIKVVSKSEKKRSKTFSLKTTELEVEDFDPDKILKLEYPVSFVIDPIILSEAVKDAEIYFEILTFKTESELLKIESIGQIGELDYQLGKDELINYESNENTIGSFALSFLKPIFKASSIVDKLELNIRTDHPLRVLMTLDKGDIKYFLAPRVVESDEVEDDQDFEDDKVSVEGMIGIKEEGVSEEDQENEIEPTEELTEEEPIEEKPKKSRKKKKEIEPEEIEEPEEKDLI